MEFKDVEFEDVEFEDRVLAEAIGSIGGRGAAFVARRLPKNVHEIGLRLPLGLARAEARVTGLLARIGHRVAPRRGERAAERVAGRRTIRVMTGGGAWNMNPVLVTAVLTAEGPEETLLHLRAAAKEGLIRQRAGEKTAHRVAALLTD
ncbi:hypothetical protein [Kitasatospora sp. NPDC085879]|uniref:hypothetical protein n=1 Tax=Kitasatospora sp. NPDC085879 TaxID=3154769 RepID=UPI00341F0989